LNREVQIVYYQNLAAYENFLAGEMVDADLDQTEIDRSMQTVPKF